MDTPRRLHRARVGVVVLAGAAYVALTQWLMTGAPASPWNAVGVLGPMLAAAAAGCWGSGRRGLALIAAIALGALVVQAGLGRRIEPGLMYLAQHAGVNLVLAAGFASTLRPGRTALITALARRIHREFTPAMGVYTRRCTLAWVFYFLGIAALSIGLFLCAPFEQWAVFANLIAPVTIGAMFVGEHLLRYRLHPEFERISVGDAIRSYRQRHRPSTPSDPRTP